MSRIACRCGHVLELEDAAAGQPISCPNCGAGLVVPGTADTSRRTARLTQTVNVPTAGSPQAVPKPGYRLEQFVLQQRLGGEEGAWGEVWLARDTVLDRDVAVKFPRAVVMQDAESLQRFLREAKLLARLNHPNVVTIYQSGMDGGLAFLVMELIEGGSLERAVRDGGPLPWRRAGEAIRQAAAGLGEAHALGLVHRDIKPANLMRTSKGLVKLVDFGLARPRTEDVRLTQDGKLLGSPCYMAPEQWQNHQADARSDLYSLVCTCCFLLTGREPFDAQNLGGLCRQHLLEPFPDPRLCVAELPDPLCAILARGSRKDPADRYQTAAELIADLDALLSAPEETLGYGTPWEQLPCTPTRLTAKGTTARTVRVPGPADRSRAGGDRRPRLVAWAGALVVVAALVAALVMLRPWERPGETTPPKVAPSKTTAIIPPQAPSGEPQPPAVPPKTTAPKSEPPKTTAPKSEPPKTTAPKSEPPKPEAPKVDPAAAEAAFQRGEAELKKGQYAEAIAAYGEAIRLNPKHGPAYSRRGRADLLSKKYPEAIADYTRAIALDPKNPAFKYRGRAEAHWHSGNREAAAADFRQLIALCEEEWKRDRDDPDSANRLAWLLATLPAATLRDGRRAVDLATKVCQLTDYESFESLETLAAACAETGDFTAAIKWAQQAIERAPDDRKASLTKELESYRSAKPWRDPPE